MRQTDNTKQPWIIDFSLGLVKRTGAFYLGRDLIDALHDDTAAIRQWRVHSQHMISGPTRKIFGKLMSMELTSSLAQDRLPPWPRMKDSRYLYLDPLYTLIDTLNTTDMVLCHDVGPLTHPHAYSDYVANIYKKVYGRIVEAKPSITFVSEASKTAFINVLGDSFPALNVIPLYMREGVDKTEEMTPVEGIERPFFLTVGEVGTRKGQKDAIAGFAASGLSEKGYKYVICGPRGYGAEEVAAAASETEGVVLLGYVTDEELNWLYENAEAFILPSLIEGFGIPSLEAARRGLLPLISKDPALQEVSGGLALTIEDNSPEAFRAAFQEFLTISDEEKKSRISAIIKQGSNYTFDRFVESWRAVLDS